MFYRATIMHFGKELWHNIATVRDNLGGWQGRDWTSRADAESGASMPLCSWQGPRFCITSPLRSAPCGAAEAA